MRFSAALLAGGHSARMGRDKAFLDWHGELLWRVQLKKLLSLRPGRVFIAARAEQRFASLVSADDELRAAGNIQCIDDPPGEDCGPMGAVARCLRLAEMPLLVLAVDLPLMTADFLRERLLGLAGEDAGVVFKSERGLESLAAVYPPAMLPRFEAAMAAGDLALHPVIREAAAAGECLIIEMSGGEQRCFENVNSPEDAERAR